MTASVSTPILDVDFFTDDNLANTHPLFKQVRDRGDAVFIPKLGIYAVGRYAGVKKALSAPDKLISGKGTAINEQTNHMAEMADPPLTSLTTDGDQHRLFKKFLTKPTSAKAIAELTPRLKQEAEDVVGDLANGQVFDAMDSLAVHMPHQIVAEMVGIKGVGAREINKWATAAFDSVGPADLPRTAQAIKDFSGLPAYMATLDRSRIEPGGWADHMYSVGERGDLPLAAAKNLIFDYVVASLDTTIHSTGELLWQLATTPELFDRLRADPALIPNAIYESVRLASPIRGHTRYVVEDFAVGDCVLPEGSRVWVLFAAANRDERHYADPDKFDLDRFPKDNLAWGYGVHLCLGKHLAIAEMHAVLAALIERVERIELLGEPERLINSEGQGYSSLPMRLVPA